MIQSSGYVIARGKYSIPQRISGTRMQVTSNAENMDNITVFEDMVSAENILYRLKVEYPSAELHIMHAAFTCTLTDP